MTTAELDHAQWIPGERTGHYESFFLRANHPTRALAFWIRYTIFSPHHAPEEARGELWAIWFDGESGSHLALKSEIPAKYCVLSRDELKVVLGHATLGPYEAQGAVSGHGRAISWALEYACDERPLLLLPERLYRGGFPRAKALVPAPMARFRGRVVVDGHEMQINDWVGILRVKVARANRVKFNTKAGCDF